MKKGSDSNKVKPPLFLNYTLIGIVSLKNGFSLKKCVNYKRKASISFAIGCADLNTVQGSVNWFKLTM